MSFTSSRKSMGEGDAEVLVLHPLPLRPVPGEVEPALPEGPVPGPYADIAALLLSCAPEFLNWSRHCKSISSASPSDDSASNPAGRKDGVDAARRGSLSILRGCVHVRRDEPGAWCSAYRGPAVLIELHPALQARSTAILSASVSDIVGVDGWAECWRPR